MKVSTALLLSIISLIGANAEKGEEQIQQEVSARMSERKLFDEPIGSLSETIFRPACGPCKFKGDFDDEDTIAFDQDDYGEAEQDDSGGNSDQALMVKMKCNLKDGCDSGEDEPIRNKYGETVCYRVDNNEGGDCAEFMKDDWFLDTSVYVKDDTEKEVRAISCTKQFSTFQQGCGCKRYKRNPGACSKNDCIFIQKGEIFSKMTAERKQFCKADLGCREWDDCNFKCQEFCEAKGSRCQWMNGACEYNKNFGF